MFLPPWQLPFPRMSDTGGDGGGDPPPATLPARQPPQNQGAGQGGGEGGSRETPAELAHRLRAEAAANRVEARRQQERAERAEQDAAEARTAAERRVSEEVGKVTPKLEKMRATLVSAELKAAAQAAGLVDLDLLHLPALDRSKIKVNDETGEVEGVAEAVEAFKKAKPDYFKAPAAAALTPAAAAPATPPPPARTGAPAPSPAGGDGETDVRKMTREQYAEWKKNMMKTMRRA